MAFPGTDIVSEYQRRYAELLANTGRLRTQSSVSPQVSAQTQQQPQQPQQPKPATPPPQAGISPVLAGYGAIKGFESILPSAASLASDGGALYGGLSGSTPVATGMTGGVQTAAQNIGPGATPGVYSGAMSGNAAGIIPYAGAAAGLYGLYDLGTKWGRGDRSIKGAGTATAQGAASGAAVGSVIPGVGTVIGGAIGGLYGLASSVIKTGKHKDQLARDQIRAALKEAGFIDDKYNLKLADGSSFNIGLDGGAKLQNLDGTTRNMYDVDLKNPLAVEAIQFANPIAEALVGKGNDKLRSDFAGYLVNAAMSNATDINGVRANLAAFENRIREIAAAKNPQAEAGSSTPNPSGVADFDAALNASLRGISAQARQDARKAQVVKAGIGMLNSNPEPRVAKSAPVRTGVENLDSILQGVLG